MSSKSQLQLLSIAESYWKQRWLWMTTTVAFASLAFFYVLFLKKDNWISSQGLIVRDEATGSAMRLGRFESQTAMKEAQETILEMAKNPQVLRDAIKAVAQEDPTWFKLVDGEPSIKTIEQLAKDCVIVRAPRGAALGTTEVIYLDVKASTKERSRRLNLAICKSLESRLQQVRETRASGIIEELGASRLAAQQSLEEATARLQQVEASAGDDLSDLRTLTENATSSSSTRQSLDRVVKELRDADQGLQQIEADLGIARASLDNPINLLQTPTKLVNSDPGLKRLSEGLAVASIATSELTAKYTEAHPLVVSSRNTEARIRTELQSQLGVAIRTLTRDRDVMLTRIASLEEQQTALQARIAKLATIRAGYSNIVGEVNARNAQLQKAESDLAAATAAREAATNSSLLTRIDDPVIGDSPAGPGKFIILAASTVGGLFFGFGIVFLMTPFDANINYGRRSHDYAGNQDRRRTNENRQESSSESTAPNTASSNTAPNAAPPSTTPTPAQPVVAPIPGLEKARTISEAIESERAAQDAVAVAPDTSASPQASPPETSPAEDAETTAEGVTPTVQLPTPTLSAPTPSTSKPASKPQHRPQAAQDETEGVTATVQIAAPTASAPTPSASKASKPQPKQEEARQESSEERALSEAQAVIAAALQMSFAEDASRPPEPLT